MRISSKKRLLKLIAIHELIDFWLLFPSPKNFQDLFHSPYMVMMTMGDKYFIDCHFRMLFQKTAEIYQELRIVVRKVAGVD